MSKYKVMFFQNGNTMVFSKSGEQVSHLQQSWLGLFLKYLEENEVDPTDAEFQLPDGQHATPFKTDVGWNWKITR